MANFRKIEILKTSQVLENSQKKRNSREFSKWANSQKENSQKKEILENSQSGHLYYSQIQSAIFCYSKNGHFGTANPLGS